MTGHLLDRVLGPVAPGVLERARHRSVDMVSSAASLFPRYRRPEQAITVLPNSSEYLTTDEDGRSVLTEVGKMTHALGYLHTYRDSIEADGPRCRIEISPGAVKIARTDPHKAERARERAARASYDRVVNPRWESALPFDGCPVACDAASGNPCGRCRRAYRCKITSWSARSRSSMRYRLLTLDYSPLFIDFFGRDTRPAMVTLTYPGDWQAVAPSNKVARRHVEQLRKRWDRMWSDVGRPLVGVWKREFQRRGAPHYHILCVPPDDPGFREWLSETWAEIVGSAWCGEVCWSKDRAQGQAFACCERGRHVVAGTGIDYREGGKATDPQRLAVYFAKHGGYAAKEYQNEGPAEWRTRGGVGRFWGVWGLRPAVSAVELDAVQAQAIARTIRRLERTRRFAVPVRVFRCTKVEGVNLATGVVQEGGHVHGRGCFRNSTKTIQRFPGSAGYVLSNDAPALASALSRVAADVAQASYVDWWVSAVPVDGAVEHDRDRRWWATTGRRRGILP